MKKLGDCAGLAGGLTEVLLGVGEPPAEGGDLVLRSPNGDTQAPVVVCMGLKAPRQLAAPGVKLGCQRLHAHGGAGTLWRWGSSG